MPKYRVRGSKTQEFYIDLEAADPDEAYDIADSGRKQWFEAETDEAIEPYEVELLDSPNDYSIQLTLDEDWPDMHEGVIIGGSN